MIIKGSFMSLPANFEATKSRNGEMVNQQGGTGPSTDVIKGLAIFD